MGRPRKGTIRETSARQSLYLPDALALKIIERAKNNGRSFNGEVRHILQKVSDGDLSGL